MSVCVCVQGVLVDVELNQRMTEVCRNSVRSFVEDRTDKDGRVSIKALNKFAQMTGFGAQEPWNNVIKVLLNTTKHVLEGTSFSGNVHELTVPHVVDRVKVT